MEIKQKYSFGKNTRYITQEKLFEYSDRCTASVHNADGHDTPLIFEAFTESDLLENLKYFSSYCKRNKLIVGYTIDGETKSTTYNTDFGGAVFYAQTPMQLIDEVKFTKKTAAKLKSILAKNNFADIYIQQIQGKHVFEMFFTLKTSKFAIQGTMLKLNEIIQKFIPLHKKFNDTILPTSDNQVVIVLSDSVKLKVNPAFEAQSLKIFKKTGIFQLSIF